MRTSCNNHGESRKRHATFKGLERIACGSLSIGLLEKLLRTYGYHCPSCAIDSSQPSLRSQVSLGAENTDPECRAAPAGKPRLSLERLVSRGLSESGAPTNPQTRRERLLGFTAHICGRPVTFIGRMPTVLLRMVGERKSYRILGRLIANRKSIPSWHRRLN